MGRNETKTPIQNPLKLWELFFGPADGKGVPLFGVPE